MISQPIYTYSVESRVYFRDAYSGIAYSDGAAIEDRLMQLIKSCSDVSDASPELRRSITDWPSEYHFSPLRANLLRPFAFQGKHVLELGCGCGAISRFLGESGALVTAVEGSPQRARIAAERCRDLPQVKIHCDNIVDFYSERKFDTVTLIGVLEYSRKFIQGADPIQRCLEVAGAQLSEEGDLYIAIENQLGLKYWNGCAEDHTGIPYFGIQDCYQKDGVVTFGRKELSERLHAAGFEDVEFFFPFPDYKLPEIVLSEAALNEPGLRIGDLLCRMASRDYGRIPLVSFHEGLAWQAVARNGLVGELANSFLVRASKSKKKKTDIGWLACTYSVGRIRELATVNRISQEANGICVTKRRLFNLPLPSSVFCHRESVEPYISGKLLISDLQHTIAAGGGLTEIAAWVTPWLGYLRKHVDEHGCLPGKYLDCIPTNLVRDANDQLHYIDAEWNAESAVPLAWIVVRGMMVAVSACPPLHAIGRMSYRQFITSVLEAAGLVLSEEDWNRIAEWENALRLYCSGEIHEGERFSQQLERIDLPWTTYPTCLESLKSANEKIDQIKSSVIWRLLSPLRAIYSSFHGRR